MRKILVRHGLSEANISGSEAFGQFDAGLTEGGIAHSKMLKSLLDHIVGDPSGRRVAVSEMVRTQQTAQYAGYDPEYFQVYKSLNEYDGDQKTRTMRHIAAARQYTEKGDIAKAFMEEYEASKSLRSMTKLLLENLPEEEVMFTHGLVIAGLSYGRGYQEYRVGQYTKRPPNSFVPYFSSIRIVDL